MLSFRKKPPTGEPVSEEFAAGMNRMEGWYTDFVVWAYAYIGLLEKRIADLEAQLDQIRKQEVKR